MFSLIGPFEGEGVFAERCLQEMRSGRVEGASSPPMNRISTAGSSGCEQHPLHPGLEPGRLPMGTVPLHWWNKYIKWNKIVMKNSRHSHPLVAPRLYWWFGCHGPQPEKPGQKKDMLMTGTNWGTLSPGASELL